MRPPLPYSLRPSGGDHRRAHPQGHPRSDGAASLHARWRTSGSDWNRLRSFLSAFCTKLFNNKRHPFRGELLDKIDRAEEAERTATFTVDEFWGVVARTPEYVQGVYVTLLATGMRWGEYERCTRDSLKSGHRIALPAPLGAPNPKEKARTIAVEEWLWPWVLQAVPCPISYAHVRKHWTRARLDAGLARYVPSDRYKGKKVYEGPRLHDPRHLKGQMLIRDVDLSTVADDLGHTQLSHASLRPRSPLGTDREGRRKASSAVRVRQKSHHAAQQSRLDRRC